MDSVEAPAAEQPQTPHKATHDPYAALRFSDFRLLTSGRLIFTLGEQMLNVAIGWELYLRTHSPLALGFVGLAQVLPVIFLSLPAGFAADRFPRKRLVIASDLVLGLAILGLAELSATRGALWLVYSLLGVDRHGRHVFECR